MQNSRYKYQPYVIPSPDLKIRYFSPWDWIMKHSVMKFIVTNGILHKADPDPDLDLQKKRTLYNNSMFELKTHFWYI